MVKTILKWLFVAVSVVAIGLWVVAFYSLATSEPDVVPANQWQYTQYQQYEDGSFKGQLDDGTNVVGCTDRGICWQNNGTE